MHTPAMEKWGVLCPESVWGWVDLELKELGEAIPSSPVPIQRLAKGQRGLACRVIINKAVREMGLPR